MLIFNAGAPSGSCSCSSSIIVTLPSLKQQQQQQKQRRGGAMVGVRGVKCKCNSNNVISSGLLLPSCFGKQQQRQWQYDAGPPSAPSTIGSIIRRTIVAVNVVVAVNAVILSLMATSSNAFEIIIKASSSSSPSQLQQSLSLASSSDEETTTLSDIPQTLSSTDNCSSTSSSSCKKARIQRPKSRKAESCTAKCVATCIRGEGGTGSPGEGPLNIRRPIVIFKKGFRSRQYCLIECSDICNLIGDGDSGP